jgi:hypothetical protein
MVRARAASLGLVAALGFLLIISLVPLVFRPLRLRAGRRRPVAPYRCKGTLGLFAVEEGGNTMTMTSATFRGLKDQSRAATLEFALIMPGILHFAGAS